MENYSLIVMAQWKIQFLRPNALFGKEVWTIEEEKIYNPVAPEGQYVLESVLDYYNLAIKWRN